MGAVEDVKQDMSTGVVGDGGGGGQLEVFARQLFYSTKPSHVTGSNYCFLGTIIYFNMSNAM